MSPSKSLGEYINAWELQVHGLCGTPRWGPGREKASSKAKKAPLPLFPVSPQPQT